MSVFDKFLKKDNFVSLPTIASKLLDLLQEDELDIRELTQLIESDPIITLKVLKLANSPLFGTKDQIIEVSEALNLLGTKRVFDVVFSVSLHSKLFVGRNLDIYPLLEQYFYNSYLVGNISRIFNEFLTDDSRKGLFISGLLHDIGRMIMIQMEPTDYILTKKLIESEDLDELSAESEVYGETHINVGTKLAEVWDLPEMIHDVIEHYIEPDKSIKFKKLNYSVNTSTNYVEESKKGDQIITGLGIQELKNWNRVNNVFHINGKAKYVDKQIKRLMETVPETYVLFK